MRWLVVLLLLPMASAETWTAYEQDGLFLTDGEIPMASESTGASEATTVRFDMQALGWNTTEVKGNLTAVVVLSEVVGDVDVDWTIEAGGLVASGETRTPEVSNEDQSLRWDVPVNGTWSAPLWWNITVDGPYVFVELDLSGETRLEVPVFTPPPAPVIGHVNITTPTVTIRASDPAEDEVYYHWQDPPEDVQVAWEGNVTSGTVVARILDGADQEVATLQWPTEPGLLNVTGTPGNWTIHITHEALVGDYGLTLSAREDPVPPTARRSPIPWLLVPLALLAARSPRSG